MVTVEKIITEKHSIVIIVDYYYIHTVLLTVDLKKEIFNDIVQDRALTAHSLECVRQALGNSLLGPFGEHSRDNVDSKVSITNSLDHDVPNTDGNSHYRSRFLHYQSVLY